MIHANELKPGAIYVANGAPCMVETLVKQTPSARGAATLYKVRARNLLTKAKVDASYRGDDVFPEADFRRVQLQYLYRDGDQCVFMDLESFDQPALPAAELEAELKFLVDGMEGIMGLILDERLVGIQLPDVVEMELAECDPAIKGQSATARTKPAKTSTGLVVQVPEYMAAGELVRIDTRDGKFLGRVSGGRG
ncbi:MAG: elongation factor P [Lentisphaeria bacterium]|jgi:elongation factor P